MTSNIAEINQYDNLGLIAKQLVMALLQDFTNHHTCFSVEFAEHKLYNFGESTRHIDWKVYSRLIGYIRSNMREETNLRCRILVDNSTSMHYPKDSKDKLRFSIFGASALAYLLTKAT